MMTCPSKKKIYKSASIVMETPKRRNPIEYAVDKVRLPIGSAENGVYKANRTPYFLPIAEAFNDSRYSRIVYCCATQMSKTLFTFLCLMYKLDESPVPCLYVSPSRKLSETVSGKFSAIIRENPSIYAKLAKGKRDKITEKYFAGVRLGFSWASSAIELSSNEAGLVIVDERDRMKNDIQGEGDPVELLQARTATYPDAKLIVLSTPTIEGASQIWSLWEEGTRLKWNIPCPNCNDFFCPTLPLLKWNFDEKEFKVDHAYLLCPFCKFEIEDKHRLPMNEQGIYISESQKIKNGKVIGELPQNTTASFWISGLCSPWRSYQYAAESFARASKSNDIGRVQASVNTIFGELWKIKGERPSFEELFKLVGELEVGQLPSNTLCLTCGVDVQKDSLYYSIRAWGYRGESWTIEYGQIFTSRGTEDSQVWGDLQEKVLDNEFEFNNGIFKIRLCAIDSGYNSHTVYFFCQTSPGITIPVRGKESLTSPVKSSKVEVNFRGRHIPGGTTLFLMDDFYFKNLLHSKIRRGNFDGAEAWHLPKTVDDEYCKQILSEELVTKASGGKTWVKNYENHYLDCEKQNEVCGYILQTSKFRESRKDSIENDIDRSSLRLVNKGISNNDD